MAGPWVRTHGEIRQAIAVEFPRGRLSSWFVPVTSSDRLLGFFELRPDLTLIRYSSFQHREAETESCPAVADWTDPATILARAAKLQRPDETAETPYLSYDAFPSRLAWAVPVSVPAGQQRIIFVAGESVFEGRAPEEFTG